MATMIKKEHKGACMCGAVKFAFSGPPLFVKECVCDSCRRAHGASAVCWVGAGDSEFCIEAGEGSLQWYQSSAVSQRGFCSSCGTRLFFRSNQWPGETHMAVACLETPHELVATGASFAEELPAWSAMVVSEKVSIAWEK